MSLQLQIQSIEDTKDLRSNQNTTHNCGWLIDDCPSCQKTPSSSSSEESMERTFDMFVPPLTNMKVTDIKGKRAVLVHTRPIENVEMSKNSIQPTGPFLALPYEVRLLIYEACAFHLRVSAACGQCTTHKAEDSTRMWLKYGTAKGNHWGVWSLAAVNHQIRSEAIPILLSGPMTLMFKGGQTMVKSFRHSRPQFRYRIHSLHLRWDKDCEHIEAPTKTKGNPMFPNLKHVQISGLVHQTRWRKLDIVSDDSLADEVYRSPSGNGNADDTTTGDSKLAEILKELVGRKCRRKLETAIIGVEYRSAREFGDIRWKMYVKTDIISEELIEKSKPFPYHHLSTEES